MRSMAIPSTTASVHSRRVLLSLHIVSTVSILGTDLVLLALGIAGLGGADPRTIYPSAHLASAWVVAPLSILALVTGLLLTLLTPWRLFRCWWVTVKFSITVVFVPAVLLVLVPRLAALADTVMGSPGISLAVGQRLPLVVAPALVSSLLVLNVFLAIFKPGGRRRENSVR